jgi:hypothetical protein
MPSAVIVSIDSGMPTESLPDRWFPATASYNAGSLQTSFVNLWGHVGLAAHKCIVMIVNIIVIMAQVIYSH